MQIKEDILPLMGMNLDDDPRHFEKGDYGEALNIRIGSTDQQGDKGLVQSIKSNLEISLTGIDPASTTQYFSVAIDKENQEAFILAINTLSEIDYFIIIKHDINTDTNKIIYKSLASLWGMKTWDSDMYKIYNPKIVNRKLIFTDGVNDIRMIDVDRMEVSYDNSIDEAIKWDIINGGVYAINSFVYFENKVFKVIGDTSLVTDEPDTNLSIYTEICLITSCYLNTTDPDLFILIAPPPLISPTAYYFSDEQQKINQLIGRIWQFTYRYVYLDYRKSKYGPPSLIPRPNQEETLGGLINKNITQNNAIKITLNSGNEDVRSIEMIARSSEDIATWFRIKIIDILDINGNRLYGVNENIYYTFYNNEGSSPVSLSSVNEIFSYVPITAKFQEILNGDRLCFANISEVYSKININITLDLSWQTLSTTGIQETPLTINVQFLRINSFPLYHSIWTLGFVFPQTNTGACTFYIKLQRGSSDTIHTVSYVWNNVGDYYTTVRNGISAAIEAEWPGATGNCIQIDPTEQWTVCAFYKDLDYDALNPYLSWNYEFYYTKTASLVDKHRCLKSGVVQGWGFIYRDLGGRISPIMGTDTMTKYIPFATESSTVNVNSKPIINFNINHTPPSWAESIEIVYAGNKSISWFLHLLGYDLDKQKTDHDDPTQYGAPSGYDYDFRLKIKKSQRITRNYFGGRWIVEEYSWQKGDRIRIFGKVNDTTGVLSEFGGKIWDVEITGVYQDTDYVGFNPSSGETEIDEWIYFSRQSDFNFGYPRFSNLFVQIYRPLKVDDGLFYTTGMTFGIGTDQYGHKYHKGDTDQILDANGNSSSPAIIVNTSHDTWKYIRNFRSKDDERTFRIWSESEYASDFYETQKMTSLGQPLTIFESPQNNILTKRLRFGGKIVSGSQVNNLAEFDYDDYEDLKDEHGEITGLKTIGFILKVLQKHKLTSIYINRFEAYTASNELQYNFTDKVFGTIRPSDFDWGCQHPDSMITDDNNLYFWDQSRSAVIRDAGNGQIPLSDIKIKRRFIDMAKTLASIATYLQTVEFAFNKEDNELFCLFSTSDDDEIVFVFNMDDGRWKYMFNIPFVLGKFFLWGDILYHLNENKLYKWWEGVNYQVLGGETVTGSLILYSSETPVSNKIFNSIVIFQTGARPVITEVVVPLKASATSREMKTYIYDVNIQEKEGVFYCDILGDINTPGTGTQNYKLMNGDKMRGLFCKIVLSFSENDKITMSNVVLISTISERNLAQLNEANIIK